MNILIIQGPNLNLLGVKSSKRGKRITLDKVNRDIRQYIRDKDIDIKIYQTHSIERVITLLQRNRNWANGIIIAPSAWSTYEAALLDTLQLIDIPTVEVYDEDDNRNYIKNSILSSICKDTVISTADKMFIKGIESI